MVALEGEKHDNLKNLFYLTHITLYFGCVPLLLACPFHLAAYVGQGRKEAQTHSKTRLPVLFVAEGEIPAAGKGKAVFSALSVHVGTKGCFKPETAKCHSGPSNSNNPLSPLSIPFDARTTDTGEVKDCFCALSSYEDTLVVASRASVHVLLRQVEHQKVDRCFALLSQQQQQQKEEHTPQPRRYVGRQLPSRKDFVFTNIKPNTEIVSVACGLNHILIATAAGQVLAVGGNASGQLGDGSFVDKTEFTHVQIEDSFKSVSVHAGRDFSFAICRSSRFPGVRTPRNAQVEPEMKRRLCATDTSIAKGGDALFAWGNNEYGQLGQGVDFASPCSCVPLLVESPISNAFYTHVACASGHAIVLTAAGSAFSFGLNIHGQLGHGSLAPKAAPGKVSVSFALSSVSCSDCRVLALSREGSVFSWGVELTYNPPPKVRFPAAWPCESQGLTHSHCCAEPHGLLVGKPVELRDVDTPQLVHAELDSVEADPQENKSGADDPFGKLPGLHKVRGLPAKASEVAAGMSLNCAICTDSNSSNSASQTLFVWNSAGNEETDGADAVRVAAQLPGVCTLQKKPEIREQKLKWHCSCSQRNVLLWARAEAAEGSNAPNMP